MLKLYYTGLLAKGSVNVSLDNGNSYVEKTLAELKDGLDIGNADTADIKIKVANANTDDLVAGSQLEIGENEIVIKNVTIQQEKVGNVPISDIEAGNKAGNFYYIDSEDPWGNKDDKLTLNETAYYKDRGGAFRKVEFNQFRETGLYASNFDNQIYHESNNGVEAAKSENIGNYSGYDGGTNDYLILDRDNKEAEVKYHTFTDVEGNSRSIDYVEDSSEPVFFYYKSDSSNSFKTETAEEDSYVGGAYKLKVPSEDHSYVYFTKDEDGLHNVEFTPAEGIIAKTEDATVYTSDYMPDYYFESDSSHYIIESYPKSEYVDPNAEPEENSEEENN